MAVVPSIWVPALLILFPLIAVIIRHKGPKPQNEPPKLSETIPFVSNTWQFITDKERFIDRMRKALKSSPIVSCWLGPLKIHFVTGGSNVSIIFRSSFTSEPWINRIQGYAAGFTSTDLQKFADDTSGGASLPRKGTQSPPPPEGRIWHSMHRMNEDGLMNEDCVTTFMRTYQVFFNEHISKSPIGEWNEDVRIFAFLKRSMAIAATRSTLGQRIMELCPDIIEAFWDWEQYGETLAFGLAEWLNRRAVAARNRFSDMCFRWYVKAREEYDQDRVGENIQVGDWEPIFGSEMSRGHVRWIRDFDFSDRTIGGIFALFSFGLHSNTIPIGTWMLIEIIKDPDLHRAVQEEISETIIKGHTCSEYLDYKKLASLPLIQSIYTEVLRLHIQILVTRTSIEPVKVAGYELPTGSVLQAPTAVPHLDEEIWGTPDHPAREFWAYRHVELNEVRYGSNQISQQLEFSMKGRTASYFPYGGGFQTCSGRKFAKCEILTSVAMIISRFDVEFVEWVNPNGSRSERCAIDSTGNAVATHPDRDMKVRWRRLW
ncbi:cytochrome P450 [Ophiobolus disseminans]|uniref:Cytochrome P450 n=1 Tax=Ophiobolus disseminans TaxID=1469910 RepID=A0A6A7A735_9PLEO|nr:cytochrome P450 [Ophiobolus disseminans]